MAIEEPKVYEAIGSAMIGALLAATVVKYNPTGIDATIPFICAAGAGGFLIGLGVWYTVTKYS